MGGLARRAAFIDTYRTPDRALLLLDGGDTLWGKEPSLAVEATQGALMVEAMNRMGYHALALGEDDLLLGEQALRQRMEEADFAVLSANVTVRATGQALAAPYAIIELAGRKVGLVGLTGGGESGTIGEFAIAEANEAAAKVIPLVAQEAGLVIVLSQQSWAANRELAETVKGIDVIVGPGSREQTNQAWRSAERCLVMQPSQFGQDHRAVVVVTGELRFDGAGRLAFHAVRTNELETDSPEDSGMLELLGR